MGWGQGPSSKLWLFFRARWELLHFGAKNERDLTDVLFKQRRKFLDSQAPGPRGESEVGAFLPPGHRLPARREQETKSRKQLQETTAPELSPEANGGLRAASPYKLLGKVSDWLCSDQSQ